MEDEYIVDQLCINLKDELNDYLVENKDIAAENLLKDVNKYLKTKDIHHE
jgi:hypothetical protein